MKNLEFCCVLICFLVSATSGANYRRYYSENAINYPSFAPVLSNDIQEEMQNYPGSKTFCLSDNDCQPHENCRYNMCIVYVE